MLAAGLAIILSLLVGTIARAGQTDDLGARADSLRAENSALDARARQALLELYAVESQLVRAGKRVARLRAQVAELERRERSARRRLELARQSRRAAQEALNARVRALYIEGDPDPLAIILGASSLDDVISAIDSVQRIADQDTRILGNLRDARGSLRAAIRQLEQRERELRALARQADAAQGSLRSARDRKAGYIASLRARQDLNQREIADLAARAEAAQAKAEQIESTVSAPPAADEPDAAATIDPGAATGAPDNAPAGGQDASPAPGRQVTVSSTMYCLRGTTATGIPVAPGVVATDPSTIPLGTRMYIPGYGDGVAADTGGAVIGWTIDMWVASCARADAWGRRTITITLYD